MTRPLRIDDLAAIAVAEQPALSPDGARAAYVLRTQDLEGDRAVTALWLADDADDPRPLTHGPADASPAWSPDGTWLAFVREEQVWLLPAAGGEPRPLTSATTLPQGAGAPVWSPDGTRIAFSAPVDPATPRDTDPIVVEGLDYQIDGIGFVRDMRRQIHVAEVATGRVRQLTHGGQHATDPAWSPDGRTLAFLAKPEGESDLRIRSAVHLLEPADDDAAGDRGDDAAPRAVAFADGVATSVGFTPDGHGLLVVGHRGDLVGHAHLYRVDLDSGATTDLAPRLDRNVMRGGPAYPGAVPAVTGAAGAEEVLFCVRDRGGTSLYAVPLAGADESDPVPVHAAEGHVVSGLSVAQGVAAIAVATPTAYGEIALVDLEARTTTLRTRHIDALGEVELARRVPREFTISDGTVVQAWLMRAPTTTGPGPLLVDVHGGPHNAWNGAADDWHLYQEELVSRGWTVLIVNPRGSDGYGERFYHAVLGAWGEADAADFLEPIDELVAEGIADPQRLAVTGYSYGGYMTCHLTGIDGRFAAAVAGGTVSDLASVAGTSDDAHYLSDLELGLFPWRDRARLADLSPYTRVDKVSTPTLVLHGLEDRTCPVGQAQQWHYALRERGVPTQMVLYPEGSHAFVLLGRPSHRIDYYRRVGAWVEQYAGPHRPAP